MIRTIKCFTFLCPFVCLILFFNIFKLNSQQQPLAQNEIPGFASSTPAPKIVYSKDAVWQPVYDTLFKFFVYSAYVETRELQTKHFKKPPVVRVIGVSKFNKKRMRAKVTSKPDREERVMCRFWYDDEKTSTKANEDDVVLGTVEHIKENWGMNYSACFIYCPLQDNRVPKSVSIHARDEVTTSYTNQGRITLSKPGNRILIRHREPKNESSATLAACVKPMHYNFYKVWELVEWIEMHRELGIEHFYFYNHTIAQNTSCVLDDYVARGIVTVLDWNNLPIQSQKEVRTENMFAALNDCLYRGMYKHKYLAFFDFDEFLVPKKHKTLIELLNELDKEKLNYAAFLFRNAFFYMQWPDDEVTNNGTELLTLRKTRRRSELQKEKVRSKYICRAERVVEVGNHMLWEMTSKKFKQETVSPELGFMHHYRVCEFGGDKCVKQKSVVDKTMWRWEEKLSSKVDTVQQALLDKCQLRPINV